jgi:hypothetical protein
MWGVAIAWALLVLPLPETSGLAGYYFATQDRYGMAAALLVLVLADAAAPHMAVGSDLFFRLGESRLAAFGVAVSVALIAAAGASLVFRATPIAYDEVQAVFDARVFAGGQLAAPVADEWRPFLSALGPLLFLQFPENRAWISAYWPVHAALRALADVSVGASWCSPLLAFLALLSTHRVARQLWPDRPDAAFVAVALMATSSQLLVTAMTPFAMTAHLAANMLWLALFLTNTRAAHVGALAVGALAAGLHQVIFHPLFVAPFILLLLFQRRWKLAAVYIGGYGLIGLGWLIYPELVVRWHNPGAAGGDPIASLVVSRWGDAVASGVTRHADIVSLTLFNLGRLAAWLNPLLVILFVAGLAVARRLRGVERAIAAGVVFTFVAMTLILPYQSHGWGYRYMHGQIGCMALVATMAWMRVKSGAAGDRRTGFFTGVTLLSLVVLVPLNAWFAYRWARPVTAALDIIAQSSADVVMIDYLDLPFGASLVRNRPDLSNRPLTMALEHLEIPALRRLCVGRTIAVFDRSAAARVGMVGAQEPPADDASWRSPQRVFLDAECHPARL